MRIAAIVKIDKRWHSRPKLPTKMLTGYRLSNKYCTKVTH